MDRRAFLVLGTGALITPFAAEGQQVGKVYRVGTLHTASEEDAVPRIAALERGLAELGYVPSAATWFSCIDTPMENRREFTS